VLPNDFALDAKRSKEILLVGEKGQIATGGHFPPDSFQYVQKYAIKSSTRCGINIVKAKDRDTFSTLFYDDENFMYLVAVDGKVEDEALDSICATQKEKRRDLTSDNQKDVNRK
jgi:hypothetical protein